MAPIETSRWWQNAAHLPRRRRVVAIVYDPRGWKGIGGGERKAKPPIDRRLCVCLSRDRAPTPLGLDAML